MNPNIQHLNELIETTEAVLLALHYRCSKAAEIYECELKIEHLSFRLGEPCSHEAVHQAEEQVYANRQAEANAQAQMDLLLAKKAAYEGRKEPVRAMEFHSPCESVTRVGNRACGMEDC